MIGWTEYTTLIIAAVTLVVAIAAFIVARRTLRVTRRAHEYAKESDKQSLRSLIASKEAQLKAVEDSTRFGMMTAYSPEDLKSMLENAGFSQVEIHFKKTSYATIVGVKVE